MLVRWRCLGVGSQWVYCLSHVLLLCGGISALSNLDVSEPIVRRSPAPDQDNFGFSAVLHQLEVPITGDFDSFINSTKLLIGAPRGTYPGGLSLPLLNPQLFTGLVYICPVNAPGDCTGLVTTETNVSSNDRRMFDGDPNVVAENKTEQLMGSFLASNGEYFMACAPLWVTDPPITLDFDARRPVGRCFVSPRNLQGFKLIQPCNGTLEANPGPALGANNQCVGGFSGAFLTEPNGRGYLALGVIGDNLFNGNIFYYNVSTTPVDGLGMTASAQSSQITNLYDGYSTTVGFITNKVFEDVISGVPRFDGTLLSGGVRIRSRVDYTVDSVLNVTGEQTGEYFGYAVAAADLNGDGFDELIVGAPFYSSVSRNLQEAGRVYVYKNTGGDLDPVPIMLTQSRNLARFGAAVVSLEDVNGDGYEDIAVGSPYEVSRDASDNNTGAVYIYYGRGTQDGFISSSPDQVILASDIVNTVPDVQSLRTFGFSLFSGVDVDANQVNDLLIGAYESRTAVLIRSLSVAYINVSVTASTAMLSIDTTGIDGFMFTVAVCASYSGRGLDGRSLDTILEVSEIVPGNVPRLFFANNQSLNQDRRAFVFDSTDVVKCVDVPVFVKSVSQLSGQVDVLSPLRVLVRYPQFPRRSPSFIGGDPVDLIDYRTIPVLIVEGTTTASVIPTVNCSLNANLTEICNPDLTVTLLNVTYIDDQNNTIVEGEAVADLVQTINVHLRYNNIGGDPAFGAVITFTLPDRLVHLRVEPSFITCLEQATGVYRCDLPFIPQESEGTPIVLVWSIRGDLIGNEPDDISNLNISIDVSSRDVETNETNNDLINGPITIEYSAVSDLDITSVEFTINPTTYRGLPFTQQDPAVDQIGQRVQLTVTATNIGPSVASDSTLDIFIPTNDVEGSYYLYLFSLDDTGSGTVACDESPFNPDRLAAATATRRKRMARMPRQETSPAPQVDVSDAQIRNCSSERSRASCTMIRCRITTLPVQSSNRINVVAFLDERFFQSQVDPFVFVAYAEIRNNSDFVQDPNPNNNRGSSPPYRVVRMATADEGFPIWIPIVCGIVAVIFIILLFVLLYFVGFFRRKKLEDTKEAEGDFVPPEDTNGKPSNEKPAVTEAPVEPLADDIGGTEDLNDGNDAEKPDPKPDVDPEETSL